MEVGFGFELLLFVCSVVTCAIRPIWYFFFVSFGGLLLIVLAYINVKN